jgi:4-hydroxy-tetrahydrodipicolinate reductase
VKTPVRVLLLGAKGRMGQAIATAAQNAGIEITGALDLGDDATKHIGACDVVIDFSNPNATDALCQACRDARKPAVIGTTGHSQDERRLIEEMAKSVAVVFSPNFSVGVNALFWLTILISKSRRCIIA